MKTNTSKKQWLLAALGCATLALTSQSNAAVIVTFAQVGSNVVATWNGTINPGNFSADFLFGGASFAQGGNHQLFTFAPPSMDEFLGGTSTATTLSASPTSTTGPGGYGFTNGAFYFPGAVNSMADTTLINFGTGTANTMTWANKTLADIGASSFNNKLAWTSAAGGTNTVIFTTVPEPSAALLGILGAVGLVARRRR